MIMIEVKVKAKGDFMSKKLFQKVKVKLLILNLAKEILLTIFIIIILMLLKIQTMK